ncbi:hypothetical protein H696_00185 [Fonticula alba]|uniref:Uncharacterized protein n=1 Tax=Fonticula alba TaxID=691883 RepID=A0A058ZF70_FONAL|nr:hypothetical protein H696_00185 [Fonticula alba]KCV72601.1 hypothetical protein H696_00185 [Fonticula alba]|eukprot:XP_009492302.1 hypothetical protein H696_00185 [Fonticula alba]
MPNAVGPVEHRRFWTVSSHSSPVSSALAVADREPVLPSLGRPPKRERLKHEYACHSFGRGHPIQPLGICLTHQPPAKLHLPREFILCLSPSMLSISCQRRRRLAPRLLALLLAVVLLAGSVSANNERVIAREIAPHESWHELDARCSHWKTLAPQADNGLLDVLLGPYPRSLSSGPIRLELPITLCLRVPRGTLFQPEGAALVPANRHRWLAKVSWPASLPAKGSIDFVLDRRFGSGSDGFVALTLLPEGVLPGRLAKSLFSLGRGHDVPQDTPNTLHSIETLVEIVVSPAVSRENIAVGILSVLIGLALAVVVFVQSQQRRIHHLANKLAGLK